MKLIDCKNFNNNIIEIKNIYISMCDLCLTTLYKNKNLGLLQFQDEFNLSFEETRQLIQEVYVDNGRYLSIPDDNIKLRYLEFGGENIKPTHLFSKSIKLLYNIIERR